LAGRFREVVPIEHQDKVISKIADYLVQMSTLRFSMIGRLKAAETDRGVEYSIQQCLHPASCQWAPRDSGPFETAINYFFTTRTPDYYETLKRAPDDSDECFAAWLRMQTAFAIVQLEFNRGPFPLHHPDLRLANILFDDDYNITGVLDWSYTMTVPIEALANLQSDFGSKDCHDSLIKHIRTHESQVDPSTPIANYLSSQSPAVTAIVPLQEFAPLRVQRLEVAKVLLTQLFGKDAGWGIIKERWTKYLLNPTRPTGGRSAKNWIDPIR